MIVLLSQLEVFFNGVVDYIGMLEQIQQFVEILGWDIVVNELDLEYVFRMSMFDNNCLVKIYGVEFVVQYFFGEIGFGIQVNYIFVNGDVGFDNNVDFNLLQFVLIGLSDMVNLVGLYEDDKF